MPRLDMTFNRDPWTVKKTEQQSDEKIPYLNDLTEHLDVQQNISNVLNRVAQLNHVVYSPI